MKKIIFILLTLLCLNLNVVNASTEIQWRTMKELIENSNSINKTILILVHTAENEMDKSLSILENKTIAQYIKKNYYTVKFNIHDKKSYIVKNCTYRFLPQKNYHQLAYDWTYGDMNADALMFLNEKMDLIYGLHGEQNMNKLLNTLQYFNGPHLEVSWDDFDAGIGQRLMDNIPTILEDYKNNFANIKGDLETLQQFNRLHYQYEYESTVIIPKAVKTSIIHEVKNGKRKQYFKSILANHLTFEEGRERLKIWSSQMKYCDMVSALEAASVNQTTIKRKNSISTIFIPFDARSENKKIEISLDLELNKDETYSLVLVIKRKSYLIN